MDLIVPFMTGLTTGGLSCLAVQGGLLASSIANEVEHSVREQPAGTCKAQPKGDTRRSKPGAPGPKSADLRQIAARLERNVDVPHPRAAPPIMLFLVAKLVAYTILGFLLGLLGSVLQLSVMTRAMLQVAIGVFMVGTALRMFSVHPIFRYFALEPPRFVTRYIRRKAKGQATAATPIFLGALTVLIPCGITQAMMAVAMGSGSGLAGATIMFAFILGTSPVFFGVAYLATRLGSRLEASFMRFVAVVVLVLGLISIDAGLTLAGWPYSVSNLRLAMAGAGLQDVQNADLAQRKVIYGEGKYLGPPSPNRGAAGSTAGSSASDGVLTINVGNRGYSPRVSHARPNQPLQLSLVTQNTYGCSRAFVIPTLGIQQLLPPSGTTTIDVPAQPPGSKLYYSCSMGMYNGVIFFDA